MTRIRRALARILRPEREQVATAAATFRASCAEIDRRLDAVLENLKKIDPGTLPDDREVVR